jgi:cardiolipin synthase
MSKPAPIYHLYHTASDSIEALKHRLREAEHTIEFETFYILPDSVGREILDILLEKAQSGVKVRLLCDTVGSFSISTSAYVKEFHKAGSNMKFFNTILPFRQSAKTIWYLRNHRRTIIIDNRILFVGSFCIGELTRDWIETTIELHHTDAITEARDVFNKTWKKSSHRTFRIGNACQFGTDAFSYITQAPLQNQRHLYNLLIRKIREAKQSIMFAVPYLIPDHRLFRALRKATKRGVHITFICPAKTDFYLADLARDSYIHAMLRRKIHVYFLPVMVHSKVAIFDAEHPAAGIPSAMIGTLNLDNISLRYNYECAIYTDNADCVHELHSHMSSLIHRHPESRLSMHVWEKRGLLRKILEFFMLPFRKLF